MTSSTECQYLNSIKNSNATSEKRCGTNHDMAPPFSIFSSTGKRNPWTGRQVACPFLPFLFEMYDYMNVDEHPFPSSSDAISVKSTTSAVVQFVSRHCRPITHGQRPASRTVHAIYRTMWCAKGTNVHIGLE